jgi:hypothetical protein
MKANADTFWAVPLHGALSNIARAGAAILLVAALGACGGGGGGDPASAPLPSPAPAPVPAPSLATAVINEANVAAVYVDGGPLALSNIRIPNTLYADVKVCAPGTTQCAVIEHVLVDTGSVGLRLIAQAIPSSVLAALPPLTANNSGALAGECLAFASGVTWGGLRSADVRLGGTQFDGQLASNIPVQVIADTDAHFANIPSSCSSQGAMMQTVAALGANGILGVGLFVQDCGLACATSAANVYYACSSAGVCTSAKMPLAQQVRNPISAFASENNGNTITLEPLPSGAASRAAGLLVFGIGTRPNNALAADSAVLGTDASGYFQSIFNGNTLPSSFIDSGSSINFFPASGTYAFSTCQAPLAAFFCPANSLSLTATNTGREASSSSAQVLTVNAESVLTANASAMALLGLGGPSSDSKSLDLGASFFFGRSISTLIENRSAPGFPIAGPAFAHTP